MCLYDNNGSKDRRICCFNHCLGWLKRSKVDDCSSIKGVFFKGSFVMKSFLSPPLSRVTFNSHYSQSPSGRISFVYLEDPVGPSFFSRNWFIPDSEADSKSKSFSLGHGETGAKRGSRPSSWARPRSRWIWSEAGHGRAGAGRRGREGSSPSCINLSTCSNPPILLGNAAIFSQ